jgi:hypothetical protein
MSHRRGTRRRYNPYISPTYDSNEKTWGEIIAAPITYAQELYDEHAKKVRDAEMAAKPLICPFCNAESRCGYYGRLEGMCNVSIEPVTQYYMQNMAVMSCKVCSKIQGMTVIPDDPPTSVHCNNVNNSSRKKR